MYFRMGQGEKYHVFGKEGYGSTEMRERYSRRVDPTEEHPGKKQLHTILTFDALLYDTVPFFSTLELPAIAIPRDEHLSYLLHELALEEWSHHPGKEAMLQSMTEQALIRICRYLDTLDDYSAGLEKLKYLADQRLIDLITFIKNNLDKDLSNKNLAAITSLSEDYIGQFFKSLTGQNLQEYVERQRLDKARQLLLSTPDSIQVIAFKTGFRDPAYFSRRFKLLYRKNANEFRKT